MLRSAWDTAEADNRLALLPDEAARICSLLYQDQARFMVLRFAVDDTLARQSAFEANFADVATAATPVLNRMSDVELREYARLTMLTFAAIRETKRDLETFSGMNEAAMQGFYDVERRTLLQQAARDSHRDDFANWAKAIETEDTTTSR